MIENPTTSNSGPAPQPMGLQPFSPFHLTRLVVEPLRYFFANYVGPEYQWDPDDRISKIDITSVNNFNLTAIQINPRILVDRGTYEIVKTGVTDNLAFSKSLVENRGLTKRTNIVQIRGQMSIIIEARNEGSVEILTDMVSHFLVWTRPMICDSQGFNDFGLPMTVSNPSVAKEDIEKFTVTISFPYFAEEDWTTSNDAVTLRGYFYSATNDSPGANETVSTP